MSGDLAQEDVNNLLKRDVEIPSEEESMRIMGRDLEDLWQSLS